MENKDKPASREIKFRAFYDGKMHDNVEAMRILYNNSTKGSLTPLYPIMQFTGLKDKNGVDIYEGDIIKCDDENLTVFYNTCAACFDAEWAGGDSDDLFTVINANSNEVNAEVIGNIYETKTQEDMN